MSRDTTIFGLGIGLTAALCYGANVPYSKLAAQAGADGPTLVLYRAFLMVVLLGGLGLAQSRSLEVPVGSRLPVLGLGIATSFVGLCYISSVAFIPVGVATILYYTYPLMILLVAPLVDGERLTPARLGIFILAFAGLFIALGPNFTSLDWRGLALALVGGAAAAVQFFCAARATRGSTPLIAGFWTQLILIPIALAACLFAGRLNPPSVLVAAAFPAGMHILLFVLAFGFHLLAARLALPAALGLVFCAEPVASILLATQVLRESLTLVQISGGALVLIAVMASVLAESRKQARPA
ncbi:DMT family transporter [Labrys okinawensis]|uniref:DMT family transporter n=1 Tax=Labrys okinawensis TaxID=346911 RepID=UPI0039BC24F6